MSKHNRSTTLQIRLKQIVFTLVKLLIVITSVFFIYNKLQYNKELKFEYFLQLLYDNNIITSINISILLIFSAVNYCLEIYKWKMLVSEIKYISFKESVKQTLSSLTASIITPNRIGEYGAKSIYFKKKNRKKILGLNLLSNLSQMLITSLFGLGGLFYLKNVYGLTIIKNKAFGIIGFAIISIILICRFIIKKHILSHKRIRKIILFYRSIRFKTISITIVLSLLRYIIFSHQFYFLLYLFNVDISYFDAIAIIFSMYLLVSVIPTIFILDLAVKSGVAIWLFSFANVNEFIVLSITTIMWIMNFAIPSIFGSYFVLKFKYHHT